MYCVMCGVLLTDENQEGAGCQHCKQKMREERKSKEQVRVSYCYNCGRPYHPTDASIRHISCFEGDWLHPQSRTFSIATSSGIGHKERRS